MPLVGSRQREADPSVCECGHPVSAHAASGWGEHSVCVEPLPDESDGWYDVCPCVRRGDELVENGSMSCCHGFDDVCVASGCLLGIPGGEWS